jgi:signal transduction histidine kinase/ActR/RegA family two-component response regulator
VRVIEFSAAATIVPGLHLSVFRDIDDRKRAEDALRFLAEASTLLASSLDHEETLGAVAELAVRRVADWAVIDLLEDGGSLRRLALAHADPAKLELARELSERHPPATHDGHGTGRVVRTGAAEVLFGADATLAREEDGEGLELLRALGFTCAMCLPLRVGGEVAGALELVVARPERRFTSTDVAFAEELARRIGIAMENARAFREAREANRLKDEFLGTVSHELRTPLNVILGWTTMLRTRAAVDVAKALQTIDRNARAQLRLIEDVLDVTRIAAGKLKLEHAEMDLARVVETAIEAVQPKAQAKGLTLEARIAERPCPFYGDAVRLEQILWNLLSNAVKFTPRGGRVTVRLEREGTRVELAVADTGRGLRADFIPLVFDRFRQADSTTTRTERGLGLGLSIVKHLVELHGGTVSAESEGEGRGATFAASLPIRRASLRIAPEPTQSGPWMAVRAAAAARRGAGASLKGVRVLACDDDDDARDLLSEVLSREGALVDVADSAEVALEKLRAHRPDVLVSDIGLPVTDGYALIRSVRALAKDAGGGTPAIALTAYARGEDALTAVRCGYQLHVTKPVDPRKLVAMVAELAAQK